MMNEQWRIDQLADVVGKALNLAPYDGQTSRRVRGVPDQRTIRYYTTLGLLDGPVELRGRTAYYGRRHVLQLVAIKRLQARGLSLVQVQQSLSGVDQRTLTRWASLPNDFWKSVASGVPAESPAASLNALLVEGQQERARSREAAGVGTLEAPPSTGGSAQRLPQPTMHLPLSEGVTLVVERVDPQCWSKEVLTRLAPAVQNLVETLRRLGLTPSNGKAPSQAALEEPLGEREAK